MLRRILRPKPDAQEARFVPLDRRHLTTGVATLAAVDQGDGPPLLFLHGGIVASDFWREIIPALSPGFRCVAIDLPGTGQSEMIQGDDGDPYTPELHVRALDEAVSALGINAPLTLVAHGWASMVAFRWAASHQRMVRAVAHMESVVGQMAWPNLPHSTRAHLRMARNVPDAVDYLDSAMAVEVVTPLALPVVEVYRRIWEGGNDLRRAHLSGIRHIPISGRPSASQKFVAAYQEWLKMSPIPKLMILGQPGMLLGAAHRTQVSRLWNQKVVGVVGAHLLAEEAPQDICLFLGAWLRQHVHILDG